MAVSPAFRFRPSSEVAFFVPDPTPEELAAKEVESKMWASTYFRRSLERGIEDGMERAARFAIRLAEDPADAFYWGNDTAIAAGKLRAYRNVLAIFDKEAEVEGAVVGQAHAAAVAYATRQALEGARNPEHSTAQLANLVKQSEVAGYAAAASQHIY